MGMNKTTCRSVSLLVLVTYCWLVAAVGGREDQEQPRWADIEEEESRDDVDKWPFLLQDSKHVIKTDAGDMRLVRGFASKFVTSPIHIGFLRMEPRTLFIPQYLDSSLILFVHCGEAKIGHMGKHHELVEKSLRKGDVYRIEAGSTFYLINSEEGQRLNVICSIDTSESLGLHTIQSFFVAGGTYPASILAGFDHATLSAAFNVSEAELGKLLTRQDNGPIVHLSSDSRSPSAWSKFLDMDHHHKVSHMRRTVRIKPESIIEEKKERPKWSIRKLLFSLFGKPGGETSPDSYNIYEKKPDFKNDYGWSTALDGSDYSPLQHDDIGVYLVNLSAGSMMAPHMNPRATEYGIVLKGTGFIEIVYPNGSLAMKAKVEEGSVFWVPRYFPFCQIASESGPFEFFGFTTSARDNRPQFLVGANSLLHAMRGPEFEDAFEMSKDGLKGIINAQRESVILPPARQEMVVGEEMVAKMIMSLGNEMVMQFD